MFEINQEVLLRKAKRDHARFLQLSEEARLIESATPYSPKLWDAVALNLGNLLVNLGNNLKSRSVYTKLSGKNA